jgi:hypothetical protein
LAGVGFQEAGANSTIGFDAGVTAMSDAEPSKEALATAQEIVDQFPVPEEFDAKQCLIEEVAEALDRFRAAGVREERERCARHIEALAIAIRDNGPKSAEGLLTATAGAQVGVLFDAAVAIRALAARDEVRERRFVDGKIDPSGKTGAERR